MRFLQRLLWIDSGAGLIAGTLMLSLSGWLAELYALPRALLVAMGVANLAYGSYSLSLARRAVRPPALIALLIAANGAWALLCFLAAARFAGVASPFGMAQLVGEGVFVGGLAALEWRARGRLVRA